MRKGPARAKGRRGLERCVCVPAHPFSRRSKTFFHADVLRNKSRRGAVFLINPSHISSFSTAILLLPYYGAALFAPSLLVYARRSGGKKSQDAEDPSWGGGRRKPQRGTEMVVGCENKEKNLQNVTFCFIHIIQRRAGKYASFFPHLASLSSSS